MNVYPRECAEQIAARDVRRRTRVSNRVRRVHDMGLFLSASGVLCPDGKAVRDAIAAYVTSIGGTFEARAGATNDRNIGVIQSTESTTTVLYPDGFTDWDDLSKFLSPELKKPVFSFHIHDWPNPISGNSVDFLTSGFTLLV